MTAADKARIDRLSADMKEQYGATMRREHIQSALHFKSKLSVNNWLSDHGLIGRQVGRGLYATHDVVTAMVLGSAL